MVVDTSQCISHVLMCEVQKYTRLNLIAVEGVGREGVSEWSGVEWSGVECTSLYLLVLYNYGLTDNYNHTLAIQLSTNYLLSTVYFKLAYLLTYLLTYLLHWKHANS